LDIDNAGKVYQMLVSQIMAGFGYLKAVATIRGARDYYWSKPD
jgi:hypothetical protein